MNGKNIEQIQAENPSLSQDLKLRAVVWSLKLSLTLIFNLISLKNEIRAGVCFQINIL